MAIKLNTYSACQPQRNLKFKFRKDHKFKIAQFTDLHWGIHSHQSQQTIDIIKHVLEAENPDLAILTGDIVTEYPEKEGWLAIAEILNDAKIPFAVTLGNHDSEREMTRSQIFDLLEPLPLFAGEKGPKLYGCGNYALPLLDSEGASQAAVIYCIDSNDYPNDNKSVHYDWVRFEQIEWYRNKSDQFTASNNKIAVPSVVFLHIPLIEFNNIVGKPTTIGVKNEAVAASDINSGLFASLVEKKNVMGLFAGHDHDNNYIGIEQGIALSYGQATGFDAYGKFERGARIIELHENQFAFNSWIRTKSGIEYKFQYPVPMSVEETAMEPLSATSISE